LPVLAKLRGFRHWGYSRIAGYERTDGRSAPSNAAVAILFVNAFTNVPAVGATLLGGTSGATSTVIAVGANYIATTKQTGAFAMGEMLKVGATNMGTYVVPANPIPVNTLAIYQYLASQVYRAFILAVPGSGPVLGCVMLYDVLYAWRANVALRQSISISKQTRAGCRFHYSMKSALLWEEQLFRRRCNTDAGRRDCNSEARSCRRK